VCRGVKAKDEGRMKTKMSRVRNMSKMNVKQEMKVELRSALSGNRV